MHGGDACCCGGGAQITKTALILVGDVLAAPGYERSKLYDPGFTTGYRKAKKEQGETK